MAGYNSGRAHQLATAPPTEGWPVTLERRVESRNKYTASGIVGFQALP